ncbi:hypothetical protein WMY93_013281 [Mugilogobius chulae]|uniref:CARMIL C-terminal domain-containing protein n=1 Tax=Mugilogobius chulae TaxID=88201 RepID=A0AAW0NZ12_9GOBI
MELPLGGPALRHYTQSRPRPHRQKLNYRPTRLQETIIECENEDFELMGRVDEGVEEFFTKKVLPTEVLKKEDEEEEEEIITVHEVAPASTVPCPPPTKTLRRKLGDFFTLKKRRGLKSEPSQEGRPKKASIADFIRPLREVARGEKDKDKDKIKEHDKENEKEKGKDGADTGDAVQGIPTTDASIPMRGEAVPPRRALREGKSQSLILLSGSASGASKNKKLDSQNSFEQKLHLMLQRIGVSKPQSVETQNQEGEMKKAESEGTIIDNKAEPPSAKPRTMSASSDTRHQLRSSVSAHESAGKPPLLPKPVIKPGPPPTITGPNTPENEVGQKEGEISAQSSKSAEATPAVSANSTLTISDTAPDSAPVLPSSKTDTHICTAEAKAEPDSTDKPESSPTTTTTVLTSVPTLEETFKSTTSPATPTTEQDTLIETPTSTLETVILETAPHDDNSITTENSTQLSVPEPNVTVIKASQDTASTSTSKTDAPAGQADTVVATDSDDSTPCTLHIAPDESVNTTHDDQTASIDDSMTTVTSKADSDMASSLPETLPATCTAAKSETPASPHARLPPPTPVLQLMRPLPPSPPSQTNKLTPHKTQQGPPLALHPWQSQNFLQALQSIQVLWMFLTLRMRMLLLILPRFLMSSQTKNLSCKHLQLKHQ